MTNGRIRRTLITLAICVGALANAPGPALAAPARRPGDTTAVPLAAANRPAHATRGVVRSVDSATMTVSRSRKRGTITFLLSPSTYREGTVVVGATVAVRYRDEGNRHVATAVTVQKPGGRD